MTSTQAANLFNVSAIMAVVAFSSWVAWRHPRVFFSQWVAGFGLVLGLMAAEWMGSMLGRPPWLSYGEFVLMGSAAWFFAQSANHLRRRNWPLGGYIGGIVTLLALCGGILQAGLPFPLALAPCLLLFAFSQAYLAYAVVWPQTTVRPAGAAWLAGALVLLGFWPLGYPFFAKLGLDWVGFWVSGLLHMLVGSGMVIFLLEDVATQLRDQNEKLMELDQLKSHFVSTVSHELRTPLTSIVGYLELLEDGVGGHVSSIQREYIETMRDSATHLSGLVDSILDSMRMQRGALTVRKEVIDVEILIESAIDTMRSVADRKGVVLSAKVVPLPAASGDSVRVTQVLHNLLGNAIKFTPEGGSIRVDARPEGEVVRIEVTDTGIGIAADQQERIFEPFVQVDGSLTRSFGGTGLGLSIVRDMVKAMGGQVGVRSAPDQGSTFWFTLPARREAHATAPLAT